MDARTRISRHPRRRGAIRWRAALVALLLAAPGLGPAHVAPAKADERVPVQARAGLDLAAAAARIWSPDAALIYLENDEPLDTHGAAPRWGYLYYSATLQKGRVYSVRGGRIVVAEDLDIKFEAPPVAGDWIDSGTAYRLADEGPARRFVFEQDGRLQTMLLMRGAINEDNPDQTTWMLVFTAPNHPALFVVLAASDGSVLRVWRG